MNTLNWLDGTDGLAGATAAVAFGTLALVSLLPSTQDSRTLAVASIGGATSMAFLIWNWPPARFQLGTSGVWFLGLYLGLAAIVGGGKIATTLLVLAWPAADAASVIVQRLAEGKAPWRGDRTRHLHYRLRAAGFSDRSIVLLATLVSAVCGLGAVLLQTSHKVLLLGGIAACLSAAAAALWLRQRKAPGITKQ
jgi:UDP-N-acetylmuramyl pentapeptide phosphotransferase/UDP-N-acetylglucosamine-1-phosphate transferase